MDSERSRLYEGSPPAPRGYPDQATAVADKPAEPAAAVETTEAADTTMAAVVMVAACQVRARPVTQRWIPQRVQVGIGRKATDMWLVEMDRGFRPESKGQA